MSVYISVHGLRPRLLLVGAGHVNRAVAHAAARVDFDICVGDIYSASLCPDAFPLSARLVHAASFTDVVEADISRLRAPIGYDIGAETPNEIAISVLAEILQVKNGAPGGLMNQVRQACQPDCLAEAVEV